MGASKTEKFTDFQNQLASMAKALGHPARVAILEHLIKDGNSTCGGVVEELPLSQSTVSQHLKAMKEAGIIKYEADGQLKCYCLDMTTCSTLLNHIKRLLSKAKCC